jgi:carboxyl-terminal processing protease
MQNIIKKYGGVAFVVIVFIVGASMGYYLYSYINISTPSRGDNTEDGQIVVEMPNGLEISADDFEYFWDAWNILTRKHINSASTTDKDKLWGSIEGLASSFDDPYTVFFPPQESKKFSDNISGNFSGVGMEIGVKNGQLLVVSPLKDTPAEKAGVRAGDFILEIDGKETGEMSVDEAVSYIRGPQGTVVKILFLPKDSAKPVERSITRAIINIPTIETELKGDVFIIRLFSFSAKSPSLFRDAIRQFAGSGTNKLILDLRGNPGGYLDAAWDMASYFLPLGKVVVSEDFGAKDTPNVFRSKGYNVFDKNLKMLILVNEGSASASEILAGALQEHGIAKLVGTKTFGKGSVQELIPLTKDTSLKITIARWLTPNGHNLSSDGLNPDYVVDTTDSNKDKDPVLDKALNLLK